MRGKSALFLIFFILFASPAWAVKNYYVDATAPTNGNGLSWETASNVINCTYWDFASAAVTAAETEPVYVWVSGTFADGTTSRRTMSLNSGFRGSTYDIVIDGAPAGKDPARIVTMIKYLTDGWSSEGGGVYSKYWAEYSTNYTFALENPATTDQVIIRVDTLVDCQSTASTYFYDSGTSTIYWHTSDGGDANAKTFSTSASIGVNIEHDAGHITIKNFTLRGGGISINDTTYADGSCDYITAIDNNIRYVPILQYAGIAVRWDSSDHHLFEGNTIQDVPVGIYLFSYFNLHSRTHDYCTMRGNIVMNTGTEEYTAKPDDDHAYAQQGGIGNIWEDNIAINTGYAYASFPFGGQSTRNCIIRRNFFMTGHDFGSNVNGGIVESMNNTTSHDPCDGNEYYQNIVTGFSYGLRPSGYASGEDTAVWDNNIVYNCTQGLRIARSVNFGDDACYEGLINDQNAKIKARNNIFLNNTYHIYLASGATSAYSYEFSYNLYYPDDGSRFWSVYSSPQSGNFAWWTGLSNWGTGTFDPDTTGSLVGDPAFINANGDYSEATDFEIGSGSAAINVGTNVGLSTDFWGTSLPQGGQYDMGVDEYFSGETPPDVNIQTGVSFTGVGMQ
jgi:hypothetical protein